MKTHKQTSAASARAANTISITLTTAEGRHVDLGAVTSPYDDRIRNWVWKQWKYRQNCKALGRMDRWRPVAHALGRKV